MFFIELIILIGVFFIGASIGSFMNVVRTRGSWLASMSGRSHCDACELSLRWHHLIPVVSYLVCLARCEKCKVSLPISYFLSEVLLGSLYVLAFVQLPDISTAFTICIASIFLVPMVIEDVTSLQVPEHLSLPFAWLTFGIATAHATIIGSIIPLLVGIGLAVPFFIAWKVSNGQAMGLADSKVALSLGFLITAPYSAIVLFLYAFWLASIAILFIVLFNSIKSKKINITELRKEKIPMVPFIAIAFFIVLVGGAEPFLAVIL